MAKILVVEDDAAVVTVVQDNLEHDKHRVEAVPNGKEALLRLSINEYDLIVLDMNLPEIGGVEVCTTFRNRGGTTPILMLTGNDTMRGKESGFSAGADDYLTKPFHPKELLLRVKALLRRQAPGRNDVLTAGTISLDTLSGNVTNRDQPVRLSPIEFALLEFLLRNPGRIFSQEALLLRVWPSESERTADTIRSCIRKLRAKIDTPGEPSFIENVHGMGYKLRA